MELVCLDFEASGLGPRSYPIEVAWKNASSGEVDAFLINPDSGDDWQYWDEFAEEMHGLDRDDLCQQGISVVDAAQRMNEKLAGKSVISDAWEFDHFWLTRLFDAAKLQPTFELVGLEHVLSKEQLIQYRLIARSQLRRHRAARDVEDLLTAVRAVISSEAS